MIAPLPGAGSFRPSSRLLSQGRTPCAAVGRGTTIDIPVSCSRARALTASGAPRGGEAHKVAPSQRSRETPLRVPGYSGSAGRLEGGPLSPLPPGSPGTLGGPISAEILGRKESANGAAVVMQPDHPQLSRPETSQHVPTGDRPRATQTVRPIAWALSRSIERNNGSPGPVREIISSGPYKRWLLVVSARFENIIAQCITHPQRDRVCDLRRNEPVGYDDPLLSEGAPERAAAAMQLDRPQLSRPETWQHHAAWLRVHGHRRRTIDFRHLRDSAARG
jgi:hypothetical protein